MTEKTASRVTLTDIAKRLNLSPKAVSMGINGTGRLSPDTRKKVLEMASLMNYRPNVMARALVTKRSYCIGVIVPYLNASFFANIIAGIEYIAYEQNFSILLGNAGNDHKEEHKSFERVMQRNVDGIIVYPREELLDFYRQLAIPVVQIMNKYQDMGDNYVVVDNLRGAWLAMKHLLELGHKKIGLISHGGESLEMRMRKQGYQASLIDAGININTNFCEDCPMSIEDGEAAMHNLLRRSPGITAVFVMSDYAALGAVRACLSRGIKIPSEMAIVGFDDLEIAAKQVQYPLTTVAQPKEQIGRLASRMMIDILGKREVQSQTLVPELKIRATTAVCG
jgi:DNA-binding LacI/PurR family transcriptional regulator